MIYRLREIATEGTYVYTADENVQDAHVLMMMTPSKTNQNKFARNALLFAPSHKSMRTYACNSKSRIVPDHYYKKMQGGINLTFGVCGPCTTQGFGYTVFFLILRISPFLMMTTATELYEGSCVLIMHMLSQYFT